MLMKELCNGNVVVCDAQTSASQAASLMRHRHVGDVVIVDDVREEGVPLGVVTDRDLVIEVMGKGLDPAKVAVGGLMKRPVVVAHESEDTSTVIERMRSNGVRRIPVVAGEGHVVGIVSLTDLLGALVTDAKGLLDAMAKAYHKEQHTRL